MQKHGDDEPEPLIGFWFLMYALGAVCHGVREWILEAAEATQLTERADLDVQVGCIRTPPGYLYSAVLNTCDVVHARNVSGSHVDEDPW